MFPGLDPKKMQAVMKQMGIAQEEIDAKRVIIECSDKNIIISNPSVTKIKMQGQTNFQISGDISEVNPGEDASQKPDGVWDEDIKTIVEKTNCTEEEARQALENSDGDLADAILSLS
ncbi:nascent polypeptide-associated complex protein [Candidatus Pacearchaeota archaeon]|nr:nascent polypeptide-associated complex protein [Candidatus Pacearchaeota archaeon]